MNFRDGASAARAQRRAVVVDLTALIDVVFQLLIFFLLTSSYVSQQATAASSIPLEVPEAESESSAVPHQQVIIVIGDQGQISLNGEGGLSLQELQNRLIAYRNDHSDAVALIQGSTAIPFGRIDQIMQIVHRVNIPLSVVPLLEEMQLD